MKDVGILGSRSTMIRRPLDPVGKMSKWLNHEKLYITFDAEGKNAMPFDVFLWGSASQDAIPWVRLTRLLQAPTSGWIGMRALERSLLISYTTARAVQEAIPTRTSPRGPLAQVSYGRIRPISAAGSQLTRTSPWRCNGQS